MSFNNYIFTAAEILRTDKPLPVQGVKPYFNYDDTERKNPAGAAVSVVIPTRGYANLTVKVPGSTAYKTIEEGKGYLASFEKLVAKPYAFRTEKGSINSGFSAIAEAVQIVENDEYL